MKAPVRSKSMANHPEGIVEAIGASVSSKGVFVGATTGLVGWLSQVNWIGMAGVFVAVLGLIINAYF
ncbi:holin [Pseudomonas phytophila]|uniref:holin n=1 Tax=Pseudomonas phytophila TaxID=2867264 RepID=UPI0021DAF146|nr:holin [Pseudomonas phytophila]